MRVRHCLLALVTLTGSVYAQTPPPGGATVRGMPAMSACNIEGYLLSIAHKRTITGNIMRDDIRPPSAYPKGHPDCRKGHCRTRDLFEVGVRIEKGGMPHPQKGCVRPPKKTSMSLEFGDNAAILKQLEPGSRIRGRIKMLQHKYGASIGLYNIQKLRTAPPPETTPSEAAVN